MSCAQSTTIDGIPASAASSTNLRTVTDFPEPEPPRIIVCFAKTGSGSVSESPSVPSPSILRPNGSSVLSLTIEDERVGTGGDTGFSTCFGGTSSLADRMSDICETAELDSAAGAEGTGTTPGSSTGSI